MNDGSDVFDKYGLIRNLRVLLNDVSVKGKENMRRVLMIDEGLAALEKGMRNEETGEQDGQDHA